MCAECYGRSQFDPPVREFLDLDDLEHETDPPALAELEAAAQQDARYGE
ncbi:hypothetical protein [Actinomadura opuntiae]|nr:hypothetical protein [Actinomadura sp. OS1-43]MDL4817379.1 hypothetical protein [Actinomadura sp. OS1-43]